MKTKTNRNKSRLFAVVVCVIFVWMCILLKAASYVIVATIGNRVSESDKSQGMQKVVDHVKNYWHKKMEQALPDKS